MTAKKGEYLHSNDTGTNDRKKSYEAPELIELGTVSELTNYAVSVNVSIRKEGGDHEA
jgi:hypothetical protein